VTPTDQLSRFEVPIWAAANGHHGFSAAAARARVMTSHEHARRQVVQSLAIYRREADCCHPLSFAMCPACVTTRDLVLGRTAERRRTPISRRRCSGSRPWTAVLSMIPANRPGHHVAAEGSSWPTPGAGNSMQRSQPPPPRDYGEIESNRPKPGRSASLTRTEIRRTQRRRPHQRGDCRQPTYRKATDALISA